MSAGRASSSRFRWLFAILTVLLVTGLAPPAAAAPAPPTGYLGCGISGTITVSPRLRAGEVRAVAVTATLTDCHGPFGYGGVPTGPAIGSGLLTVAGTGTLDPAGPVPRLGTDCAAARLVWQPANAWQIVWKSGPAGTGATLGRSVIAGMTMDVRATLPNSLLMGIFNFYGETDGATYQPASWTGAFADQSAFYIGGFGNVAVVADTGRCDTHGGLRTLTFSGPTGDPRADPPATPAVRIDL